MGLFDKKFCSICGKKIGLLGNRKLEDGNLCGDCAKQLSPYFSDRKNSTVDEIKEQLAYREENKTEVGKLCITKTLGERTKVLLDEDQQKFVVSSDKKWMDANPDVMDYSMVTGVNVNITENRRELKQKDSEGKDISYSPPRYRYSYDFYITLSVNHPYFSEMKFRVNDRTVEIENDGRRAHDPFDNPQYVNYNKMCEEIKSTLTNARKIVRQKAEEQAKLAEEAARRAAEAAKPRPAVVCPHCLATTIPDENGRCEYCGGAVK